MGKEYKKEIRRQFRNSVFIRDKYQCKICKNENEPLDAHHITDRNEMPNGGYVPENGISLCPICHETAEEFHKTGNAVRGFAPSDLYDMIGSSYELAIEKSKKLG